MCSSICQFVWFLFQFIELLFYIFLVFLAQLFVFDTDHFILLVQLLRLTLLVWEHEDKPSLAGVPLAVCVTDKSVNPKKHTIAEPLHKIFSRRTQSPWLTLVHQLRPSVMLKNTPTKDFFFIPWWPFPPLASLFSLDDVFCHLPCDLRDLRRIKDREMKRWKRWVSCHEKHIEKQNKKLF